MGCYWFLVCIAVLFLIIRSVIHSVPDTAQRAEQEDKQAEARKNGAGANKPVEELNQDAGATEKRPDAPKDDIQPSKDLNVHVDARQQREESMREAEAARQQETARQQELARREAAEKQAEENRQHKKIAEDGKLASRLYRQAFQLWLQGFNKQAQERCEEIIRKYPDTVSAAQAKKLQDKMRK